MSYWSEASHRAFSAAWDWPNSHSIPFAVLSIVLGAVFSAMAAKLFPANATQPRWVSVLKGLGLLALSGVVLTFLATFIVFLITDAPEQIAKIQHDSDENVKVLEKKIASLEQKLDERESRKEIRIALSKIAQDGLVLMAQIGSMTEAEADSKSQQWDLRLKEYFISHLDESYYIRLADQSEAAKAPSYKTNSSNMVAMWGELSNLQKIIREFQ